MAFITLKDIYKTYRIGDVRLPVLKGVSLDIQRGEFVALMGASGSGKTTLMNLIGGLDLPTSGSYQLDGIEMTQLSSDGLSVIRNDHIGFVFQCFNLLPRTTAMENVLMPTIYSTRGSHVRSQRQHSRELLRTVGLEERLDHSPAQLSGGEQQRVAIARALVNRPRLLLADEPTGNLDSRTGREILQLFRRLNEEQGITILLVTHNAEVAAAADRVVKITDGLLVEDIRQSPKTDSADTSTQQKKGPQQPSTETKAGRSALLTRRSSWRLSPLIGSVRTAFTALRRNMLRSTLTMIGVIIGVAAVVAVMEVSQGASDAITQTVVKMGAFTIQIKPGSATSGGVHLGSGSEPTLTPGDAEAIGRDCSAIENAAPVVWDHGAHAVYGNRNWVPYQIIGSTSTYLTMRDWTELESGRMFTDREIANSAKVCLIGQTLRRELFGDRHPIGEEIRLANVPFTVIGVLNTKGASLLGVDQDDILFGPWTTIKYRVDDVDDEDDQPRVIAHDRHTPHDLAKTVPMANIDLVLVQAVSSEKVPLAIEQLTKVLRNRHRIAAGNLDDFDVRDMAEISRIMQTIVGLLSGLVMLVACFSLIVGGVGIMNIMLVSVTERTREIGLRMAVGACASDILRQFLIESIVLCAVGGVIGIAAGHGVTLAVGLVLGWPTPTSVLAAVIAISVAVTVGVSFGYYPAWKASRLNPIDALRYE